jgi:hypothetical protein
MLSCYDSRRVVLCMCMRVWGWGVGVGGGGGIKMLSLAGSPQVSAPLEPIVADGLTKRDHDGWFNISGRHRDGLQVKFTLMSTCVNDDHPCQEPEVKSSSRPHEQTEPIP